MYKHKIKRKHIISLKILYKDITQKVKTRAIKAKIINIEEMLMTNLIMIITNKQL